jgi:hypothetical protein
MSFEQDPFDTGKGKQSTNESNRKVSAAEAGDRVKKALEGFYEREAKKLEPKDPAAKRYTTEYAIEWGLMQGWAFVERERVKRFQQRGKWQTRHEDLAGGSDAMFRAPDGMVFVQGAGLGERASHRRTFEDRRVQLEDYRNARFVYVEFERGDKEPRKEEWWA